MPGLVGMIGTLEPLAGAERNALSTMVAAVDGEGAYRLTQAASETAACALLDIGVFDHRRLFMEPDGAAGLLIDGWVWEDEVWESGGVGQMGAAEYLYRGLRRSGDRFLADVNGEFAFAMWDDRRREAWLGVDRFGLRSLQYAIDGDRLLFGCEGKAVVSLLAGRPDLSAERVLTSLAFGHGFFTDESFFRGVRVVPGGCTLHCRSGQVRLERYWDLTFHGGPRVDTAIVRRVGEALTTAVRRRMVGGSAVGLQLSGGLDSRLLAGALASAAADRIVTFTFGPQDSDETRLAARVATEAGLPWWLLRVKPSDFIDRASEGVWLTEGLDTCCQSYGLHVYPEMARAVGFCMTGLELEVTLGGQRMPPAEEIARLGREEALTRSVLGAPLFDAEMQAALWSAPAAPRYARELVRDLWKQCPPQSTNADAITWFTLRYAASLRYRQSWMRRFIEECTPSFDRDLIDILRHVPAVDRTQRRLQRRLLCEGYPRLATIPYQATMMPVTVPVEFWEEAASLEGARDELARAVWRSTSGSVAVPSTRHFSDYELWLRADPAWVALTDKTLLSNDCRLAESGADVRFLRQLVDEHRRGTRSHRRRLLALLTVELLLRSPHWEGVALTPIQDLWS